MASSLRVNAIVPASGTNVAIGTAGGTITFNANISGVSTFSGGIVVSAGTTAAPSISPSGDSNTGIFFPSADTVCIGEGGTEVIRVNSSGNVGIGTINPLYPLHINGNSGTLLRLDGSGFTGTRDVVFTEFGTDAYGGIIRYDSVADLFTFGTLENSVVKSAININRASGIVTTPHQPSFFAYKTGGDTTTNVGSIIVFDGTAHNTGSHYSTSTGKFTAPVSGVYAFHAQIWAKNGTTAARTQFFVNSGNVTQHGMNPAAINLTDHAYQMSMVRSLSANDTVDIRVDTANLTYFGGGGTSHTYFTGYLVG